MAQRLASIKDKKEIDWKGGFSAMRYLPRFFGEIYKASGKAFVFNVICRLVNALSPIILLYVGKLLIDEIILQINSEISDYSKICFLGLRLSL